MKNNRLIATIAAALAPTTHLSPAADNVAGQLETVTTAMNSIPDIIALEANDRDTDPTDEASLLEITAIARAGSTNRVAWTVEPTRLYRLQQSSDITNNTAWSDSGLGLLPPGTSSVLTGVVTEVSATTRFPSHRDRSSFAMTERHAHITSQPSADAHGEDAAA